MTPANYSAPGTEYKGVFLTGEAGGTGYAGALPLQYSGYAL